MSEINKELPKLGKEPTREQLDPLFPWSDTYF